jgi:MerR family transcriptional regulator, thiopeptide resistance regulator
MSYTVGRVAALARVSVRTLHHYDEIGLLSPAGRSEAGYRLYTHADLERLQQVLFFRELGLALDDIRRIMEDPSYDVRSALGMQRRELQERARRTSAMIEAVDAALDALERGEPMRPESMFESFDPSRYEEEVEQRWGSSEAYRESRKRTSRYRKEDWQRIQKESHELLVALAAHLSRGSAPTDAAVMDLAERHRLSIDRWYYPCPHAMHRGLGEMYVADARFAEKFESYGEGLAAFLRDAIEANALRAR